MPSNKSLTLWKPSFSLRWHRHATYYQRQQVLGRPSLSGLKEIQGGACIGLSIGWIQRFQANGDEDQNARCAALNSHQAFESYERLAALFVRAGATPDRMARVVRSAMGDNAADNIVPLKEINFIQFKTILTQLNGHRGYYLINMVLKNSGSDHMIAIRQTADSLYLFDPNFGEFKVTNANRISLFSALAAQYKKYVNRYNEKSSKEFERWYIAYLG